MLSMAKILHYICQRVRLSTFHPLEICTALHRFIFKTTVLLEISKQLFMQNYLNTNTSMCFQCQGASRGCGDGSLSSEPRRRLCRFQRLAGQTQVEK